MRNLILAFIAQLIFDVLIMILVALGLTLVINAVFSADISYKVIAIVNGILAAANNLVKSVPILMREAKKCGPR